MLLLASWNKLSESAFTSVLKCAIPGFYFCKLCNNSNLEQALDVIEQREIVLSRNNAYYLLQGCLRNKDLKCGFRVQRLMLQNGLDLLSILGDHIIRLFTVHGHLLEAKQVFDKILEPTVYTWSSVIFAEASIGQNQLALQLYTALQQSGVENDKYVYLAALKACSGSLALVHGRYFHHQIARSSLEFDIVLGSTIIDVYAKCGSLEESHKLLNRLSCRNVVSWSALLAGYVHYGHSRLAIHYFEQMQREEIKPNEVTFLCILKACGNMACIVQGRLIHEQILAHGIELDAIVGSTLVDMYAKCGSLEESHRIFDELHNWNIVSWSAMIAGYANHGEGHLALDHFENLQREGLRPDAVTFSSILKACGSIGAIGQGRLIHDQVVTYGFNSDTVVGNSLTDMYAKCGALEEARRVFDSFSNRSVVSWGAMVAGYAQNGKTLLALDCFKRMQEEGMQPDKATIMCIILACNRAGLVDEGHWYLEHSREYHGIMPDIEEYSCMIELLGHAGYLVEAEDLLQETAGFNVSGWRSLLNACKMHGDVELAKQCFDRVVHLDPCSAPGYVMMSNMYADTNMLHVVEKMGHSCMKESPPMIFIEETKQKRDKC